MSSDSSCAVRTRSGLPGTQAGINDVPRSAGEQMCAERRAPVFPPSRAAGRTPWVGLALALSLTEGLVMAGPSSSGPTMTETLSGLDASARVSQPEAPNLYQSWNLQLSAQPSPSLLLLTGTPEAHGSSGWFSPWVALGLGLLAGAVPAFFLARRLSGAGRSSTSAKAPLGGGPIELLASSSLNDDGSVLVVDVMGEQLVLGVSGRRDFVTLLTKVGDASEIEHLDPAGLQALIQARRQDSQGEGVSAKRSRATPSAWADADAGGSATSEGARTAPVAAARSLMPPPMDEEHSQDEDLEELLDELLGKVRGLKPLAKHPDEA